MDNLTYEALSKYFTHLSNVGYFKQSDVDKLIVLTFIQELLDRDFRGLITEDDYNYIVKAMYCLYGSSCLIPYPDYYSTKTRGIMYIGSMSELTHRVEALEEAMEEGGGIITDKQIIVPLSFLNENISSNTSNVNDAYTPTEPVIDD